MLENQVRFVAILDKGRHDKLKALATKSGISRGAVIRQLLDHAHQMAVLAMPTCSTGQRCYCPQMHPTVPFSTPTVTGD